MKKSKKSLNKQRTIVDGKLAPWIDLAKASPPPRSGWLKAIREALGLSSRQLAKRLGTSNANVVATERREIQRTASLESLDKAARAMRCKLIYAIVPENESSLEALIDKLCLAHAEKIQHRVKATMHLEAQDADPNLVKNVGALAVELKETLDPSIWEDD